MKLRESTREAIKQIIDNLEADYDWKANGLTKSEFDFIRRLLGEECKKRKLIGYAFQQWHIEKNRALSVLKFYVNDQPS